MESLLEKLPTVWKLVFLSVVSVGIPGSVSFAILKNEVGHIQQSMDDQDRKISEAKVTSDMHQIAVAVKLEEIQRSLGRLEGKLDGNRR